MAALTQGRMTRSQSLKTVALPLAGSTAAWQGGMACLDTAALGAVTKGQASTTLVRLGVFATSVDNSASTTLSSVLVSLDREIWVQWFDNDTGANAVAASGLLGDCYILNDHTVTTASSGNSKAGRVWAVDSFNGVAVEACGPTATSGL